MHMTLRSAERCLSANSEDLEGNILWNEFVWRSSPWREVIVTVEQRYFFMQILLMIPPWDFMGINCFHLSYHHEVCEARRSSHRRLAKEPLKSKQRVVRSPHAGSSAKSISADCTFHILCISIRASEPKRARKHSSAQKVGFAPISERAPKSAQQNRTFCTAKSAALHTLWCSLWNWQKPHFLRAWMFRLLGSEARIKIHKIWNFLSDESQIAANLS